MPRFRARSANARTVAAGYSTPPGLFGLTSTTARVRGPIRAAARAGSGIRSSPVGSATARTPAMAQCMAWLKYQGTGISTSSPAPASAERAAVKAWLQPVVIATCAGAITPP